MSRWVLVVEVKAEDRNDVVNKLIDKLPSMLVNDLTQDGSVELELKEVPRREE